MALSPFNAIISGCAQLFLDVQAIFITKIRTENTSLKRLQKTKLVKLLTVNIKYLSSIQDAWFLIQLIKLQSGELALSAMMSRRKSSVLGCDFPSVNKTMALLTPALCPLPSVNMRFLAVPRAMSRRVGCLSFLKPLVIKSSIALLLW